jgi:hypothetical protein
MAQKTPQPTPTEAIRNNGQQQEEKEK